MIDYNKISDREYLNNQIEGIRSSSDIYVLSNELKMLSQKINDNKIDPLDAKIILGAIRNRQAELSSGKRYENPTNADGGRSMTMRPTSAPTPTVMSDRVGSASIIFLLASVAATTVMYTLLILGALIK